MSERMDDKHKNTFSWITSIAVSVLCCSALFVLFASYMVDLKDALALSNMRIQMVETREGQILTELESIHKHLMSQAAPAPAASAVVPSGAAASTPVQGAPTDPAASAVTPLVATPAVPSGTVPVIAVPEMTPPQPAAK